MKITYGINQLHNLKLRHECHSLTHTGDWDDPITHQQIITRIKQRHPQHSITGYAPAPTTPRTYTFTVALPHDSTYPLTADMLTTLISDDSLSLQASDITVKEIHR